MITIRKGKGKFFNKPTNGKGLTPSGRIIKNDLLDRDITSGQSVARKLK